MSTASKLESLYSPEILQAVGLLFVTAASCENGLALQLARLVTHPRDTLDPSLTLIMHRTELKPRLRQIQTLAHFKLGQPHTGVVIDTCNRLSTAYERRNEFAHYMIAGDPSSGRVILRTMKWTSKGQERDKPYTVKQIRSFAEQIHRLTSALDDQLTAAGLMRLTELKKPDSLDQLG